MHSALVHQSTYPHFRKWCNCSNDVCKASERGSDYQNGADQCRNDLVAHPDITYIIHKTWINSGLSFIDPVMTWPVYWAMVRPNQSPLFHRFIVLVPSKCLFPWTRTCSFISSVEDFKWVQCFSPGNQED